MPANNLDSAANKQREEEKVKELSQSHPQWESELECVVHNAKLTAGDSDKTECNVCYSSRMPARVDGIYRSAVGVPRSKIFRINKMPDVDSYDSSSGIAVDVQQRLNCALP
jgi:hypothetical protein